MAKGEGAGPGRPLGSISRITKESRDRAIATGELPHEFLLRMSRGEPIERLVFDVDRNDFVQGPKYIPDIPERMDAAKAAAPYFAPKISTVEVIHGVSDDELDRIIARAAAEAGVSLGADGEVQEEQAPPPARSSRVKLLET